MLCPTCKNVNLVMSDRQGIEIDYCPQCRGIWLDRGELDKIIDRSIALGNPASTPPPPPSRPTFKSDDRDHHRSKEYDRDDDYGGGYKKRKREGFLSDLFDF